MEPPSLLDGFHYAQNAIRRNCGAKHLLNKEIPKDPKAKMIEQYP